MGRNRETARQSDDESGRTRRLTLATFLSTAGTLLIVGAGGIREGLATTAAGGLIPDAEIAAATFVDLDLGKFPKLPPNQVPATGTIFVSPQGDDAGSGSRLSPFRTIAQGVRAAGPGSTIVVREGTYLEAWEPGDYRALVLTRDHLTLMAYPGESVTMKPAGGVTYGVVVNAQNLVLRGIDLQGFSTIGVLFDSGVKRNRHIVIADLEIEGSEEAIAMWEAESAVDELLLAHVTADAIIHCGVGPCSSWRLENVTIEAKGVGWGADAFAIEAGDNFLLVGMSVLGAGSDGIDTKATRVVVLNSRVGGVQNNAIKLWHGGDVINTLVLRGGESPIVVEKGRFRLLHSTLGFTPELADHRDYSLALGYDEQLPMQIEIINSIISNPSGGVWINPESSAISIRNSLFHTADGSEILIHGDFESNYRDGADQINRRYGSANLTVDPLLDGDLRPPRSSPAIDAGIALPVDYPSRDIDDMNRIFGTAPDLGAYEAGGAPLPAARPPGVPRNDLGPGRKERTMKLPTIALAASLLSAGASAQPVSLEHDSNRIGLDYRDFNLTEDLPELCRDECEQDPKCKAFTYVKPSEPGEPARCWLKHGVPPAEHAPCCVSGVKHAAVPGQVAPPPPGPSASGSGLEPNTDRPGHNYRDFGLPADEAELCRVACMQDRKCKAFTYVKSSGPGQSAHCWLKDHVPPAEDAPCCVSGVKQSPGQVQLPPITATPPPAAVPSAPGPSAPTPSVPGPSGQSPMPGPSAPGIGLEPDTNRRGQDYSSFDLAQAGPEQCRDACMQDPKCRAFTYVKPGILGNSAQCWLKDGVPAAEEATCCVSGVKPASGQVPVPGTSPSAPPVPPGSPPPAPPVPPGSPPLPTTTTPAPAPAPPVPGPSAPTPGPSVSGLTWSQDFESPTLEGWELVPGAQLVQGRTGVMLAPTCPSVGIWDAVNVADLVLEFDFLLGTGGSFVNLRGAGEGDQGSQYHLGFAGPVEFAFVRKSAGQELALAEGPLSLTPNTWYRVSVRLAGGSIEVRVGGTLVVQAVDPQPLGPGRVEFGCGNGSGFGFDNISITSPELPIPE